MLRCVGKCFPPQQIVMLTNILLFITAQHHSRIWKRYVNDTCVVIGSARKEEFLEHINSLDPHIQFTTKDVKPDGSIPFLDTIVMSQPNKSLITSVYRKPTHTDLCLHWDSHHHLSAKFSVVTILKHRAKTVCSSNHL